MRRAGTRAGVGLPVLLAVCLAAACGPKVSITRMVPAPYNLGPATRLVLVEAKGNRRELPDFVRAFAAGINGSGVLRLADATAARVSLANLRLGDQVPAARELRRRWPGDVYLGLDLVSCRVDQRSQRYTEKDSRGNQVTKRRHWAEAECEAQVEVVDGRSGQDLAAFEVSGTGSSSTWDDWRSYQADEALAKAVGEAASHAVSLITPRRVTEAIDLEDDAPQAKAGIAMIEDGRYAEARALWERALGAGPASAPLHYNLGAVSEALGDTTAARAYYQQAVYLAPAKSKYREALDLMEQRIRDAESLRRRR